MTNPAIPPLRDMPADLLKARQRHLLTEIRHQSRARGGRLPALTSRRLRVALIVPATLVAAAFAGIALGGTGWLIGDPAPKEVVTNFGSYSRELGFDPDPNSATVVARDGAISVYAARNAQGTYCTTVSAPWKPVTAPGDGGSCVSNDVAAAELVAGVGGASASIDGSSTVVVAGRVDRPGARAILFTDPSGNTITKPIGHDGFFVAGVAVNGSPCANGDWTSTFSALDASGDEILRADLTLAFSQGDVCILPTLSAPSPG